LYKVVHRGGGWIGHPPPERREVNNDIVWKQARRNGHALGQVDDSYRCIWCEALPSRAAEDRCWANPNN